MRSRLHTVVALSVLVLCSGIWLLLRHVPDARESIRFGLVALFGLLACWLCFERVERTDTPARVAAPEAVRAVPPPGGEIDRILEQQDEPRDWQTSHRSKRLRERLEAVAVDVLSHDGLTQAEARDQLANGTWTDDPVAAAFLAGRTPPVPRSVWDWIDPFAPTPFVRVVSRSVDALLRRADRPSKDRKPTSLARFDRRLIDGNAWPAEPASDESIRSDRGGSTTDVREIEHWRGVGAFALLALAMGLAMEAPGLLLGGAIGVGYAGYATIGREPTVTLRCERELTDTGPRPGDDVVVTVTVLNDGDRTLPDVRIVDGVPPPIGVTGGSPRHAATLRPGERTQFSYTIEARRGEHTFGRTTVLARDVAETVEVESEVGIDTTFVSKPDLRATLPVPLREQVAQFVGAVPTRTGGDGLEFHSVRGYRRGDPLSRVDWKRRARTGELATVSLREERAADVVVVIDSRESAYRAPEGANRHACDRGVAAAAEMIALLLDTGNRVGLATVHPEPCWMPVRTGSDHRARIREALATHPSVDQTPSDDECYALDWLDEFRTRYDAPAQVIFVSPVCDDTARYSVRTLETRGFPVTLVSVDPTGSATAGQRFARLERFRRLYRLRTAGVRVVDWNWDEPIELALARASRRWTP